MPTVKLQTIEAQREGQLGNHKYDNHDEKNPVYAYDNLHFKGLSKAHSSSLRRALGRSSLRQAVLKQPRHIFGGHLCHASAATTGSL
jgi:hypothetical protein